MQDDSISRRFAKKAAPDAPIKNRAQRRAEAKARRGQQRRGQKAFDRQQREQARVQREAQREVIREGYATTAYWNGLPTFAARGTAVVTGIGGHWIGTDPNAIPVDHGPESPVGKRTKIVAVSLDNVNYGGGTVYLYDEDGSGWRKVTEGHGGPAYAHREVEVDESTLDIKLLRDA